MPRPITDQNWADPLTLQNNQALRDTSDEAETNTAAIAALDVSDLNPLAWTTYVPSLTASTTNPTLGTGGAIGGRYQQIGSTIIGWAVVSFGTAGTAAGSGTYYLSLPVTARDQVPVGSGFLLDGSVPGRTAIVPQIDAVQSRVYLIYTAAPGYVTHAAPFAWAANDWITINFHYEV